MALSFYSPADIIVVIGGVLTVSGFMEGTFLEVNKDLKPYQCRRTPDGTTARLYIKDRTYTLKFTLAQTSDSNDVLTRIQQLDEITQLGYFPLLIKDSKGSTLLFSPTAWIEEIPNQTFGTNIEPRTWGIRAVNCVSHIGGNEGTDGLFDDLLKTVLSSAPVLGDYLGDLN